MALAAAACVHRPPPPPPASLSPSEGPSSVTDLAQAIDAGARRSDHEPDSKIRGQLAAQAGRDADACLAREPQAAACLYGSGVALGLMAKAHPTRAGDYLAGMLDALAKAESADPLYQDAGPARVRALVLIRAPSWPLGPGTPWRDWRPRGAQSRCGRCTRRTCWRWPKHWRSPEMPTVPGQTICALATRRWRCPALRIVRSGCTKPNRACSIGSAIPCACPGPP